MDSDVILKWDFSPADYFEGESINFEHQGCAIAIKPGAVEARVSLDVFDKKPDMREELHKVVDKCFFGAQLLTHKSYSLSESTMERLHPDGRRDRTMIAEAALYATASAQADMILKDKDGNVIGDSRRDRIDSLKSTVARTAKLDPCDTVAVSLQQSFSQAVNDPANELVHLYEIAEALSKRFGGDKQAQKTLGVSRARWSAFGRLANDAPLSAGQHRGKKVGKLREATSEELAEARGIAQQMVVAYLKFLETEQPKPPAPPV